MGDISVNALRDLALRFESYAAHGDATVWERAAREVMEFGETLKARKPAKVSDRTKRIRKRQGPVPLSQREMIALFTDGDSELTYVHCHCIWSRYDKAGDVCKECGAVK